MNFSIRPASRSEAKPLIGLYAESGRGKTFSALLLARGFVGPKGKIVMIETEGGRGEAFSDAAEYPEIGGYDVCPIRENFAPSEFGAAITEVEQAKADVMIVDTASNEWSGAGGVLAMAALNQEQGKKGPLVWQRPKMDHQRHFMLRLIQTPIPLVIVCMRAKYPMKQKGKDWARADTLEPTQADDILFEMFAHGWLDEAHCLHVTKLTTKALAEVFVDGQPITVDTGKRLAAWAGGKSSKPAAAKEAAPATPPPPEPTTGFVIQKQNTLVQCQDIAEWHGKMLLAIAAMSTANCESFRAMNAPILARLHADGFDKQVDEVEEAFNAKKGGEG